MGQKGLYRQTVGGFRPPWFTQSISQQLYWACYMPDTLLLSAKGMVDSAAGLSLSARVSTPLLLNRHHLYTAVPHEVIPTQLPQQGLQAATGLCGSPGLFQFSVIRKLGSDTNNSFLWAWLAWVTSRYPRSIDSQHWPSKWRVVVQIWLFRTQDAQFTGQPPHQPDISSSLPSICSCSITQMFFLILILTKIISWIRL